MAEQIFVNLPFVYLSRESRAEVDSLVSRATAAGGTAPWPAREAAAQPA
jgi:predicted lactoylglutathione lyase